MKIRSLLLGSVAAAGLSTAGFAADLGVVTSLDVCDELGISGLTISSDDNCLVITGGVTMEYSIGDYEVAGAGLAITTFDRTGGTATVIDANGNTDSDLDIDAWLKFVATADSDFGPATATIKLLVEDYDGIAADPAVVMDEAWVGIGDTTMLMAGHKGSIFADGDDAPLNYLGLFNSSDVDAGVGFSASNARGGDVAAHSGVVDEQRVRDVRRSHGLLAAVVRPAAAECDHAVSGHPLTDRRRGPDPAAVCLQLDAGADLVLRR